MRRCYVRAPGVMKSRTYCHNRKSLYADGPAGTHHHHHQQPGELACSVPRGAPDAARLLIHGKDA